MNNFAFLSALNALTKVHYYSEHIITMTYHFYITQVLFNYDRIHSKLARHVLWRVRRTMDVQNDRVCVCVRSICWTLLILIVGAIVPLNEQYHLNRRGCFQTKYNKFRGRESFHQWCLREKYINISRDVIRLKNSMLLLKN